MSTEKSISTKEALAKVKELQEQQTSIAKTVIEGIKPLIQSSKFVAAIEWTQYTPYFNDGDTCEFSVHEIQVRLSDEGAKALNDRGIHTRWIKEWNTADEYDTGTISEAIKEKADILNHEDFADLDKFFGEVDDLSSFIQNAEGALREAFGDHAKVVVTPKGIETEHYEHD